MEQSKLNESSENEKVHNAKRLAEHFYKLSRKYTAMSLLINDRSEEINALVGSRVCRTICDEIDKQYEPTDYLTLKELEATIEKVKGDWKEDFDRLKENGGLSERAKKEQQFVQVIFDVVSETTKILYTEDSREQIEAKMDNWIEKKAEEWAVLAEAEKYGGFNRPDLQTEGKAMTVHLKDPDVTYDIHIKDEKPVVMKDGEEVTYFGENFAGVQQSAQDFYDRAVTLYVNGEQFSAPNFEVTYACDALQKMKEASEKEWNDKRAELGSEENRVNPTFKDYGTERQIPLDYVSENSIGYADGDDFLLLDRASERVITDIEAFYVSAISQEIESGETIHYMGGWDVEAHLAEYAEYSGADLSKREEAISLKQADTLLSDMEYIGQSQPAWSGHEYAVEYEPARDVMTRLAEFAEKHGDKEQAGEIREWLASGEAAQKETDKKGTQTLFQKSDERFDELLKEGIENVASTLAYEQAKDYLTQPLEMMYVNGENDSSHYGYLADFNPETLKTMADIAKCDASDVRAAIVEIGTYASGSPTSVEIALVDSNAQYHDVKLDDISAVLKDFRDDIIAASDYTDKAEIRSEQFVEYGTDGAQYTPAQLALMNEFAHLYEEVNGDDAKAALNCLQNNGVFLGGDEVDTAKLLELVDSINGHMQSMTADDKSNISKKEGITMAQWGQKPAQEGQGKDVTENLQAKAEAQQAQDVQATSQGKGWGQKNNAPAPQKADDEKKEPAMAQIAKSTSDAMKDNADMRKLAFQLMKTAKEMGEKAKEQGLTTTGRHKSKTGETYETVNKFYVKVEPVKSEKDGQQQENLLGSITHTIGNTTLAVHTKKDSAELSSITAVKFNPQHQKEAYAKGIDEIQANPAFNKYAKAVAQMIVDEGYVKAQEQTQQRGEKPVMLQFAQYAQAEIFKGGAQVMKDDGTTVADCYANYKRDDQYGDRTELRSHTAKDIVIEVSYKQDEQYGEQPVAKATNFGMEKGEDGRFPSMYINKPEDLNRPEFETVPAEIKQAVADFKGFEQKEQQKTTEQQKEAPKKSKGGEER